MSERFKELVLKTSDASAPRVRISPSPPSNKLNMDFDKFSRGDVLKLAEEAPLLRV